MSNREFSAPKPFGPLRSFGRVRGRALSRRQQYLFETLYLTLSIPSEPVGMLDPLVWKPDASQVIFEIGFGGGEHLVGQAKLNQDRLYLGAEPFQEGVAKALVGIQEFALTNVRLLASDARPILKKLKPASLDLLVILFPDPWHKSRHTKRRLIQDDFLQDAYRALKLGGELRFATDWSAYAAWTLAKMIQHSGFDWLAEAPSDWREPPKDHITTRYETKGLGDCRPIFLRFITRPSQR
ncbi:tRNA (guanosine(46)-N7)-methyltransferase TrmB [Candidatus Phycosocius spiralis]|uniref:tRNA (guanine-N(7)-)-methyltransferase n=1 Tax=Candidatus Phycosocius spiralis TaxID=2815099 RepID=A0ABQ4PXA8_9PROT|nr:tRNA (guanosine(46)-N7)-methyltransferase TrmB [Candidatus Phycosocius spiralis]GIU67724.1 tRNA (guanine-N(7)-)-methyltransferase [Candidatus Phycosocius spiralis]